MWYQKLTRDEKLREISVSYLFLLIIALMLSRVFNEPLPSISDKHNYKTFAKSPPVSLLHDIENILNFSWGKCHDSLTMAALSFTKSTGLCTIFFSLICPWQQRNCQLEKKDDTDTSLKSSFRTYLWYSKRICLLDN